MKLVTRTEKETMTSLELVDKIKDNPNLEIKITIPKDIVKD